ncbi:MAG: DUF1549 and DUF1553 domain-containing protein [Mariniblastus sp.]|nr:DUF1549 and DUF1553 domain-containing protein [Mariniblastus sp.]
MAHKSISSHYLAMAISLGYLCGIGLVSSPLQAMENENAPSAKVEPTQLVVTPTNVNLKNQRDIQSLVVQAVYPNGITRDVTGEVTWQLSDEAIASRNNNVLSAKQDGETALKVTLGNLTVDVPVKVTEAALDPPISFKNDVMPVFTKTGCNSGSCHGAARGKDGFRLSLYGFDPNGDYYRLTREMLGRRIDLALPDDCLLMTKATGQVAHTGGNRFQVDSKYYDTLKRWLVSGAPNDGGPVPTVTSVELYPADGLLNGAGETQQMSVRAIYSDGTDRDVTSLAYFSTNNDNALGIDQSGLVTAKNRGEAFVMARFDTHTVGSDFIVLPKDLEFQWAETPENNYVDTLINNKLKKLRIQPSELCSDTEFMRRVSLDICGIVPTPAEILAFEADPAEDKRSKYIDQLLERKEFVEIWVMKWSELLQIRSTNQVSYKATLLYYNWLQAQIANNVPVDQMIKDLLGSEGGTFANAATNYYQNEQNTLKIAENVAQVFMGTRVQCAQCHNHPFDRWTMDDYYGFVAFFSQIGRKGGADPRETIVFNSGGGETRHPVTNQNMTPKFLGGDAPDTKGKDRRAVLAEWLASKENPFFAKNLANVVWAHFFGRGIVDEVDDVRISNPPVNKALLDELGSKFTEYNYDFKKLVRDICNSRTYQLSTQSNATNESDQTNFSHASLRRIRSEILLDVISQVTETQNKFRGLPVGARAVQIADGNTSTYFLTTFGRAKRESVCSCEVITEPNLGQALHLLNGDTINAKIQAGKVVEKLLNTEKKTPDQIIEEIYMRCLGRRPNETEKQSLVATVTENEDKLSALQDIFWAVLNSQEFVFNH